MTCCLERRVEVASPGAFDEGGPLLFRRRDAAQLDQGSHAAVEVAAACPVHPKCLRPPYVCARLGRRMLVMERLHCVESKLSECAKLRLRDTVRAGMREGGRAAGLMDDIDCLLCRRTLTAELVDVPSSKVSIEGVLKRIDEAEPNERAGNVRTREGPLLRLLEDVLHRDADALPLQPRHDAFDSGTTLLFANGTQATSGV